MQYKTHLVTSLAITLPLMTTTDTLSIGSLAAISLGALFPDIDEPKSWIGRRTRGISDIIHYLFGHRGITHSLVGLLFISFVSMALVWLLNLNIIIGLYFILGYALHMIQDSFSVSGVAWLQPFSNKKFQFGLGIVKYKTGSLTEKFILLGFSLLLIVEIKMLDISSLVNIEISPMRILENFF